MRTPDDTAFPLVFDIAQGSNGLDGRPTTAPQRYIHMGMSLRDYFAAKAMQAVIKDTIYDCALVAEEAYQMADAMLAERVK